jgi:hypothetical protein
MKKYLLLFVLLFQFVCTNAQDHLKFRGIPINGNIENFILKMRSIGYEKVCQINDGALMKGEFAGMNCEVTIICSQKTHTVAKIVIDSPKYYDWVSIKMDYLKYKDQYSKKYGNLTSDEYFIDPYHEGDGLELQAISSNKGIYSFSYTDGNGVVYLKISNDSTLSFGYEDKENMHILAKEEEEKIQDQI